MIPLLAIAAAATLLARTLKKQTEAAVKDAMSPEKKEEK